jgi:hypothetical protein
MTIYDVLNSVAAQVNAGALGPNVTASVSGGREAAMRVAHPPDKTPDAMRDDFRQYRGDTDDYHWRLGDCIDNWVVEMAGKITQRRIYRDAAIETDLSISEIRVLHETARGTDAQLRDEFGDVLTHSHYRVLRYVDDRSVKHGYLAWCVESADAFGGRPAPAAVLARKVKKEMGLEPPEPTFGELLARAVSALERARDACEDAKRHDKLNALLAELEKMA